MLAPAAYPPGPDEASPGPAIEWVPPAHGVPIQEPGGTLMACVGLLVRRGTLHRVA